MTQWKAQIVVVGAGPAGIAAATTAAARGRDVLLIDDNPSAGGQIWRDSLQKEARADIAKRAAMTRLARSGARFEAGCRVFDCATNTPGVDSNGVNTAGMLRALRENQPGASEVIKVYYESLIIATGARELFLPFPGWTLPGVFGAGGLQALVRGGFAVKGKRIVVAGSGPLLLAVAAHLEQDGAIVTTVAEQASRRQLLPFALALALQPGKVLQGLSYRHATSRTGYLQGCWPVAAHGPRKLTGVQLTNGQRTWLEPCELLACGFHLVPNTELATLLGCRLDGDAVAVEEATQQTSVPGVFCAGEPTGVAGLDAALLQGRLAGLACSEGHAEAKLLRGRVQKARTFGKRLTAAFRLREELSALADAKTLVCRCEDIPYERLKGYSSWTEAKLQTRCGMGPCQGRICGPATRVLFDWRPSSIRPPLFPVPISAFAGTAVSVNNRTLGSTAPLTALTHNL